MSIYSAFDDQMRSSKEPAKNKLVSIDSETFNILEQLGEGNVNQGLKKLLRSELAASAKPKPKQYPKAVGYTLEAAMNLFNIARIRDNSKISIKYTDTFGAPKVEYFYVNDTDALKKQWKAFCKDAMITEASIISMDIDLTESQQIRIDNIKRSINSLVYLITDIPRSDSEKDSNLYRDTIFKALENIGLRIKYPRLVKRDNGVRYVSEYFIEKESYRKR